MLNTVRQTGDSGHVTGATVTFIILSVVLKLLGLCAAIYRYIYIPSFSASHWIHMESARHIQHRVYF